MFSVSTDTLLNIVIVLYEGKSAHTCCVAHVYYTKHFASFFCTPMCPGMWGSGGEFEQERERERGREWEGWKGKGKNALRQSHGICLDLLGTLMEMGWRRPRTLSGFFRSLLWDLFLVLTRVLFPLSRFFFFGFSLLFVVRGVTHPSCFNVPGERVRERGKQKRGE